MQRRTWDAATQALSVLEGLKGTPVAEICTEHELSQSLDYRWREQWLAHAANACERAPQRRREARLGREDTRLKQLVGALLLELKNSDARLGGGGAARAR